MQDVSYDEDETVEAGRSGFARAGGLISTVIGAVLAMAMLITIGVWFYRLGVRDAQNVPIIRASLDPVKSRPTDPGGVVADHQDVSSYEIAEADPPRAAAAVIAPPPPEPRDDDLAMSALERSDTADQPDAGGATTRSIALDDAEDGQPDAPQQTALLDTNGVPDTTASPETPADNADNTAPEATEAEAEEKPEEAEPELVVAGTEFAPAASPVARKRPADLMSRVAAARSQVKQNVNEIATAAASSAVQIQLAANPSETAIRDIWRRVSRANEDILRDRALAIQTTVSGGTTYYRLRVGPFKDGAEARAVCQALRARGQECIVARNG